MAHRIIVFIVILPAIPQVAHAYDVFLYQPYLGPYRHYYGLNRARESDRELARLRRELRAQRIRGGDQVRRQAQELDRLRQQAFDNHRVSARQACFYRTTGGFEVCADLFPEGSEEIRRCDALVIERNPSCNEPVVEQARTEP